MTGAMSNSEKSFTARCPLKVIQNTLWVEILNSQFGTMVWNVTPSGYKNHKITVRLRVASVLLCFLIYAVVGTRIVHIAVDMCMLYDSRVYVRRHRCLMPSCRGIPRGIGGEQIIMKPASDFSNLYSLTAVHNHLRVLAISTKPD